MTVPDRDNGRVDERCGGNGDPGRGPEQNTGSGVGGVGGVPGGNGEPGAAGTDGPGGTEHHVLVLPDRDAAEDVARSAGELLPLTAEPRLVRDALAGEDDAEDAQWLVVVEGRFGSRGLEVLDTLAEESDGWREEE